MIDEAVIPNTQFAIMLQESLTRQNISLNDLAKEMGPSYEYFRRMLRGTAIPTDPLLRMMAQYLGWKFSEVQQIVVQDRMRIKFGKMGAVAQGINPEVEPFQLSWPYLTEDQKKDLLSLLKGFLVTNRKSGAPLAGAAASNYNEAASSGKKKAKRG